MTSPSWTRKAMRIELLKEMRQRVQAWDTQLQHQITRLQNEAGRETSCKTCLHWLSDRCSLHKSTPPEEFVNSNTCEDHDDSDIPF